MAVGPTMVIKYFMVFSPGGNGNPAVVKVSFSWCKRATNGSSFYALEKQLESRGVAEYSWIGFLLFYYWVSAMITKFCIWIMIGRTAIFARFFVCFSLVWVCFCQFGGYNSCGNGNDSVTENHDHRSDELSQRCCWRDVSIAHGCQGDNGPINTHWNAGKPVFFALDDIHY